MITKINDSVKSAATRAQPLLQKKEPIYTNNQSYMTNVFINLSEMPR